MEEMLQSVPRDIEVVTQEICDIKSGAQALAVVYAVEIGRRLIEAKAMLPHGEWGKWLSERVDFTPRTAQRLMLAAEEFGSEKSPLLLMFSNATPVSHLPYSKALELLALPPEDREEFVAEHDLTDMTRKEIADAIKERDEARKEAAEAAKKAKEAEEAVKSVEALKKDLASAVRAADDAQKQLREVEKKTAEQIAAARASAKKEAKEKAERDAKAELDKARSELADAVGAREKAATELRAAEDRASALEKKLKMASPVMAVFKSKFEDLQGDITRLRALLTEIQREDPETGAKLAKALKAYFESEIMK